MSEKEKDKKLTEKIAIGGIALIMLVLLGASLLVPRYQTQTVAVTAAMKEDHLDFHGETTIKDLLTETGRSFIPEEGKLYRITIRYLVNGEAGNVAVYGCSEMETVTTFLARKPNVELQLTTRFNSSRITDQAGNPFQKDSMYLSPYVTVEELS